MDTSVPPPHLTLFARAVIAHLQMWPALRLALSNAEIQQSSTPIPLFASEIVELFSSSKSATGPSEEDLEDLLLQVMEEEFETFVDDDSQRTVARSLLTSWKSASEPDAEMSIRVLEVEGDKAMGVRVAGVQRDDIEEDSEGDDDGEDQGGEMEVDEAPQLVERAARPPPVVDDEGFTLVAKKGRR